MKLLLAISVIIVVFTNTIQCGKILAIFPMPIKSQHILGSKLLEAVARRGHQVTMISPYSAENPIPNYTEIVLKELIKIKKETLDDAMVPKNSLFTSIQIFYNALQKFSVAFWENKQIQKLIQTREKYDVLIVLPMLSDSLFGLAHHLEASTIVFNPIGSWFGMDRLTANPTPPYIANPLFPKIDATTFSGRLINTLSTLLGIAGLKYISDPFQQNLLRKYLPNAPPLEELQNNISLVFLNSHNSFHMPQPLVPNMIQIGGFHMTDMKKLPDHLQTYLDESKDGAVLLTFGSNILIANLEQNQLNAILNGFKKIAPIKVLMKSEIDIPNLPSNVKIFKWLPQNDILAHPNIKAFVSHGGAGGTMESIYNGVPIVGMPFFGDQVNNILEVEKAALGVYLKITDLNEEVFANGLKEVLHNTTYRTNIKQRSALLRDQPVKPIDNAIFWIEHVIKYGGASHLKNAGTNLTWYQLYYIDIILFLLLVLFITLYVNYKIVKWVFSTVRSKIFCRKIKEKTN